MIFSCLSKMKINNKSEKYFLISDKNKCCGLIAIKWYKIGIEFVNLYYYQ